MNDWQPIETAPKDGTLVLVYGVVISYDGTAYRPDVREQGVAVYRNEHTTPGWYDPHAYYYDVSFDATHWAALPAAPAVTA